MAALPSLPFFRDRLQYEQRAEQRHAEIRRRLTLSDILDMPPGKTRLVLSDNIIDPIRVNRPFLPNVGLLGTCRTKRQFTYWKNGKQIPKPVSKSSKSTKQRNKIRKVIRILSENTLPTDIESLIYGYYDGIGVHQKRKRINKAIGRLYFHKYQCLGMSDSTFDNPEYILTRHKGDSAKGFCIVMTYCKFCGEPYDYPYIERIIYGRNVRNSCRCESHILYRALQTDSLLLVDDFHNKYNEQVFRIEMDDISDSSDDD